MFDHTSQTQNFGNRHQAAVMTRLSKRSPE
jgi:hypothetical protein